MKKTKNISLGSGIGFQVELRWLDLVLGNRTIQTTIDASIMHWTWFYYPDVCNFCHETAKILHGPEATFLQLQCSL